jgi:hypothetical protein
VPAKFLAHHNFATLVKPNKMKHCLANQKYLEWTPSRIMDWAGRAGPFTARLVEFIIADKPHAEMGYRSSLGVIRLSRKYGVEHLEAACTRAVRFKLYSYQSVKSILECGLDRHSAGRSIIRYSSAREPSSLRKGRWFICGLTPEWRHSSQPD